MPWGQYDADRTVSRVDTPIGALGSGADGDGERSVGGVGRCAVVGHVDREGVAASRGRGARDGDGSSGEFESWCQRAAGDRPGIGALATADLQPLVVVRLDLAAGQAV